ncbi:MAG: (Fe-S)-binding protein, partial [Terrimicrobiaceae bacterium]
DIAKLKAEFLQHYHDSHGVPLRSRLVAGYADSARIASLFPKIYNALFQTPWIRKTFNRVVGFHPERTLPKINRKTLRSWFASRRPLAPLKSRNGRVHLFCDEFTNFNDLDAGIATIELLELLGYEVIIPDHGESGRASLSKGLIRRAKRFAEKNVRQLSGIVSQAEPLIGIEPSAILGFRDEYPALVEPDLRDSARALAPNCLVLDEFLAREADAGRISPDLFTGTPRTIHLHGHCHQKALVSLDPTVRMLSLPSNYEVKIIPSGCCGMAGSFGYEVEHFDISVKIGELVLFPAVRKASAESLIAAPGTSCRHQIHDGTGRTALHPAEILRAALRG